MLAFAGGSKPQDLSYLSHRQPHCWHLASPPSWMKGERYWVVPCVAVLRTPNYPSKVTGMAWNGQPASRGMRDRDAMESVTGIAWNR